MTRPKVDPEKRQRTACACDSCKRRKQKCNGLIPCNTCTKRRLPCEYTPAPVNAAPSQSPIGSPTKRRHVDTSPEVLESSLGDFQTHPNPAPLDIPTVMSWEATDIPVMRLSRSEIPQPDTLKLRMGPERCALNGEVDSDCRSRMTNTSGPAEEAEVYPSQRMLQDSTGRLLYVGDSATLSYLQLIRMIVDGISGESDFTRDPNRHMIMEARIERPPSNLSAGVLPCRRTADILVESYFVNTTGIMEVFDRQTFIDQMNQCYNDPLTVHPSVLCQLNLVFAIGLVLSQPTTGSEEDAIIKKLRGDKNVNRADMFFRNAKSLADPVAGFEDADFWSIQALILMALYMLSVSKRNAAYAYNGMAVRSAFALGLHREEGSVVIFSEVERKARRNLWRALFVLDRFLAASLGRPAAISEDDCSDYALDAPEKFPVTSRVGDEAEYISSAALDAAVKTCHVIGITLKKVYSKGKISTIVAQEIADQLKGWNESLHAALHWRQATTRPVSPSHGVAILHINLLHCHSIILLTRPFFLYILNKAREYHTGAAYKPSRLSPRMESFAQTCIEASQHTLAIAKAALDAKYLPQCNPFVIYFVFAAGLIVLSNEFAALYHYPDAETAIMNCILILKYCAENDAQAQRVSYIVETFHHANINRPPSARKLSLPGRTIPTINTSSHNNQYDPMANFFHPNERTPPRPLPTLAPTLKQERPLMSAAADPSSIPTILPSVLQQPSPEGSGTSPGNSASVSVAVHGIDAPNAQEAEFDFDSLWPPNWQQEPTGGMPMTHHHVDPAGSYGPYGMGQPPGQPQIPLGSVHSNASLYQTANFR